MYIELTATSARHSRVKPSTTARIRKGRPSANLQPFLAIETTELLVVHDKSLTARQHKQAAIAEATANRCKLAQPLPQSLIMVYPSRGEGLYPVLEEFAGLRPRHEKISKAPPEVSRACDQITLRSESFAFFEVIIRLIQ
jgi:hypothetical protein